MEHPEPPVQLPNNIEGVSIHLSYIRKDIDTISKKLDAFSSDFVTNNDFSEHLKADADHELRIRKLENWGSIAIGALAVIQFVLKFVIK